MIQHLEREGVNPEREGVNPEREGVNPEREGNMVISVSCFIGAGDILLNKLSKTIISVCSGNGISLGLVGFGQYVAVKVI